MVENTAASNQQLHQQLRQQLRDRRRKLSEQQQQQAAKSLADTILASKLLQQQQDIALYLANDGEIDPAPLLSILCGQGRRCYLPVIQPDKTLRFAIYQPGDELKTNHFGIPEPITADQREPQSMDLVFMPLVGFDRKGGRLGMGGGFYDRSFNVAKLPLKQPQLVGLAHQCQQVESLVLNSWDIPLSLIATDEEIISAN